MKIVEFTRDMAPHVAGESRIVPDLLAEILAAEGSITNVRPWPPEPRPSDPTQRYLTRVKRAAKGVD